MLILSLVTAALSIPLSLGSAFGYQLNPAYLLAPLIAWAYFRDIKTNLNIVFAISAACGFVAVIIANFIDSGHFLQNTVGLLEALFAPSFIFLGVVLSDRFGLRKINRCLAHFSSVFLLVGAVPILVTFDSLRVVDRIGQSFLNIDFFNLPVYATFGVNSLAPLFCIQVAIIIGAIYGANRYLQAVYCVAIVCGVFLAVESQSRSSILSAALLIPFLGIYVISNPKMPRAPSAAVFSCLVIACVMSFGGGTANTRFVSSIISAAGMASSSASPEEDRAAVEEITTGRYTIWLVAVSEWAASPMIGNGFAGFGRFNGNAASLPKSVTENATAHNYYINLFWKGGLLFGVPFLCFMFLALRRAWEARNPMSPEWLFGVCGVLMMLSFPSLLWDILMIPSAGAMAWFLLGALGCAKNSQGRGT